MFEAKIFEIFIPRKNASVPEMKIVEIIIVNWREEIVFRICKTADAAPVLILWIEKIVMKERPMTIVFIIPTKKRNCWGEEDSSVLESSEEMTAACPEPKPGKKEAKGAVSAAEMEDFKI